MATDIRVWTGTAWESLKGEQGPIGPDGPDGPKGDQGERGPPGPAAVSANAGNASRLGSDGLVHTPVSTDAENEIRLRPNGLYARTPDLDTLRDVVISELKPGHALTFGSSGFWENDTLVSSDPGNQARLGSDGKIFTPAVSGGGGGGTVTGDYLPLAGGTLTGNLSMAPPTGNCQLSLTSSGGEATIQALRYSNDPAGPVVRFRKGRGTAAAILQTASGDSLGNFIFQSIDNTGNSRQSAVFQATATSPAVNSLPAPAAMRFRVNDGTAAAANREFALEPDGTVTMEAIRVTRSAVIPQGGLNSTAIGPLNIEVKTADYQLQITDAGKIIANGATTNAGLEVTFTIPTNLATPFPIGTVIEIMDASSFRTVVKASAGVTLLWNNPNYTVSSDGSLAGGVAASARLRGRLTTGRLLKAGTDTWYFFGDIASTT